MLRKWYFFLSLSLIVIAPITRPASANLVNFTLTGHCTSVLHDGGLTLTDDGGTSSITTVSGTFDHVIDPTESYEVVNFGLSSGNTFTWSIGGFELYPSHDFAYPDSYNDVNWPFLEFRFGAPSALAFFGNQVLNGLNVDSYDVWAIFDTSDTNYYTGVWDFDTYSTVPVPPAILLLGSAIVGLAGFRKKVYNK